METPKETERYSKTAAPTAAAETSQAAEAAAATETTKTSSPTRLRVLLEGEVDELRVSVDSVLVVALEQAWCRQIRDSSTKGIAMAKKTVTNNKTGIDRLPDSKPVVYKIKTEGGSVNYVGVAQRGRVQERLKEHLPNGKDYVPGAKVQIEQCASIAEAKRREAAEINRTDPKHNKTQQP